MYMFITYGDMTVKKRYCFRMEITYTDMMAALRQCISLKIPLGLSSCME